MKKLLSIVLAALLVTVSLASCTANNTNQNGENTDNTNNNDAAEKTYVVGISQLVTHVALDAATKGFKDVLVEEFGDKVEFDEQNAANDTTVCTTIANSFVSKNVDLILANATPALQAAAEATLDIPILGTSVTEYGVALSIDNFDGLVGGNISGTSDLAPLSEQAQMIVDIFPDAENIGLLYCSAEANSEYQVQEVKRILEEKGLTANLYSFADSNDVATITEKAASDSDVIYVPTDNTVASCTETIKNVVLNKKVPVIAGEEGICSGCGVATLSISYEDLGRATGAMAVKILKGETDIAQMPIEYASNPVKKYNAEICAELGITPPEGYVAIGE